MSEISTVSIKFRPGTYAAFRNLQNKVWFAIGEYVDNALQSYLDNREALKKAEGNKYQFKVEINIDWEKDTITITDNAAGISLANFRRAFEPANIPIDNRGLHEFGMGMKTASIWLSDIWKVRSGALGEKETRSVQFNLHEVLEEETEDLKVESKKKLPSDHFTEITLTGLTRNAPSAFQMSKLKNHLASIYRKFIRTGEMELWIKDELLIYKDPEVLVAPVHSNLEGNNITWKKDINFKLGKHRAVGFIGLLNELSTNEHNGLSLFRRGRVIEGSHDEKYRPKSICGQVGSFRYKRVFGELELEGFGVSFNKGSFQDEGDVEALMNALRIELSKDTFNLLHQADHYRLPKGKSNVVKVAKDLVKSLKKDKAQSPLKEKVRTSIKEIGNKSLASKNKTLSKKAKVLDTDEDVFNVDGTEYTLKTILINEKKMSDIYTVEVEDISAKKKFVSYKVNLSHPFFNRFEQFRKKDDYKPIIILIRSLVIAEVLSPYKGTKNAGNVRIIFNTFLRNS
jgi:hypothetical protein